MKNLTITVMIIILTLNISFITIAQSPMQLKYQAVIRDAAGNIMDNQDVTVNISILKGNTSGLSVFDEQHNVTTTTQGLINLNIGSVNMSVIDTINWSSDSYFIKISVDGTVMGTSQLLSVPYAFHSNTADNFTKSIYEIGDIKHSLAQNDHNGWYLLNGRNISELSSVAQQNAISLGYSTNLPDMSNRFLKTTNGTDVVGSMGGNDSIKILQENIPDYTMNTTSIPSGSHAHTATIDSNGVHSHTYTDTTTKDGSHSHSYIDRFYSDSGLDPSYATGSGDDVGSQYYYYTTTSTAPDHQHDFSGTTDDAGKHGHNITIDSDGSHTHDVEISSGGNGKPIGITPQHMVTNTFIYLGE